MTTTTAKPAPAARRFGAGILASHPVHTAPYTTADLAWWASESAAMEDARLENERFDRMAEESAFMDRYERGLTF